MDFLLFYDQRASHRCFLFTLFFLLVAGVFFCVLSTTGYFLSMAKESNKRTPFKGRGISISLSP